MDSALVSPVKLRAMAILWPAFLMAGVLEALVFSMVEPDSLRWFGAEPMALSPTAVYTLAFFVFWLVLATASGLTLLLGLGPDELNQPGAGGLTSRRRSLNWPR